MITDIPPVQALVAQVMGDLGTPGLLLDKGADAHMLSSCAPARRQPWPTPDLVVWIGPELTPWLDRALEGSGHRRGPAGAAGRAEGTHLTRTYGEDASRGS